MSLAEQQRLKRDETKRIEDMKISLATGIDDFNKYPDVSILHSSLWSRDFWLNVHWKTMEDMESAIRSYPIEDGTRMITVRDGCFVSHICGDMLPAYLTKHSQKAEDCQFKEIGNWYMEVGECVNQLKWYTYVRGYLCLMSIDFINFRSQLKTKVKFERSKSGTYPDFKRTPCRVTGLPSGHSSVCMANVFYISWPNRTNLVDFIKELF